ncbi:MAG: nucleotide excision repair endonuclease [Kiritimatiellae bacterium]|nr:nucleotide excision repair endonuclease [Kiritimatiellia bacterium]
MTALEQQTCTDGFLLCLLETWQDKPHGAVAFQARLFDGGRKIKESRAMGRTYNAPAVAALLKMLYRVMPPPHVLAVYGRGWRELLLSARPDVVAQLRILDLQATAVALEPTLKARAPVAAVARAFEVAHAAGEALFFSDTIEGILWAVIRRAGERGLDWDGLLRLAEESRRRADFSRCDFDENTLAALPPAAGVYIMREAGNEVLYVGKSANLARRMDEYYREADRLSHKMEAIRNRVRRIEYRLVGSELEALLLENKLIAEFQPELNVQRRVAEGRSRYGSPLVPVVIVERSAKAGAAEFFFVGGRETAVQLRVQPKKAPGRLLGNTLNYFCSDGSRLRRGKGLTDWAATGREICRRYFMTARDRLHWREITPRLATAEGQAQLLAAAAKILTEPPPPGEYRES